MGDNMTLNLVSEITTTIGELNTKIEKQDKAIIGIFSYVSNNIGTLKNSLDQEISTNNENSEIVNKTIKNLTKKVDKVVLDYKGESDLALLEKNITESIDKKLEPLMALVNSVNTLKESVNSIDKRITRIDKIIHDYDLIENRNYIFIKKINLFDKIWYWIVNKMKHNIKKS